ncbi:MAG: DNA polymerase IV [Lachnospiraceae bacterium]|nr:DNA polymerase IV [Lachnospiraceae bacterium]
MGRVILHVDANSFYASCELCYKPWLKDKPVAVGGDQEARHGIVLTANPIAKKKYGIKTGEVLWEARQKCPQLIVFPADYPLYVHFSKMMREIEEEYSDCVEAFGLDENWIDLSSWNKTLRQGEMIAQEIRQRIKDELGITVSIGVADNKIMAKLGSDMKKPDAVTVLPKESYPSTAWRLPASDLLYVGPATTRKLKLLGVNTIGDLALCDSRLLQNALGKNGLMLKVFALGADPSPVRPVSAEAAIKSVGNSVTAPRDMENLDDVKCVTYLLAESVAARMREHGLRGKCASLSIRSAELVYSSCQCTLNKPTYLTTEIADAALELFSGRYADRLPLRSIGISMGKLSPDTDPIQLSMFGDDEKRFKEENLEHSIDGLRDRFGHQIVQRGIVFYDRKFMDVNPREVNTIHPISAFSAIGR